MKIYEGDMGFYWTDETGAHGPWTADEIDAAAKRRDRSRDSEDDPACAAYDPRWRDVPRPGDFGEHVAGWWVATRGQA